MKVGVIGCGGMGTTHYLSLKALSSQMDVEVIALADCGKNFTESSSRVSRSANLHLRNGTDRT